MNITIFSTGDKRVLTLLMIPQLADRHEVQRDVETNAIFITCQSEFESGWGGQKYAQKPMPRTSHLKPPPVARG